MPLAVDFAVDFALKVSFSRKRNFELVDLALRRPNRSFGISISSHSVRLCACSSALKIEAKISSIISTPNSLSFSAMSLRLWADMVWTDSESVHVRVFSLVSLVIFNEDVKRLERTRRNISVQFRKTGTPGGFEKTTRFGTDSSVT